MQLTIDADLQKAAEDGFKHSARSRDEGYNGAAIVLDPEQRRGLSLVSLPAYDPNKFAVGLDPDDLDVAHDRQAAAAAEPGAAGTYSPGSTFKLVVATAALEEGPGHAGLQGVLPGRGRPSTAATSSAISRAATASSTCATRSRSRATSTSTRSATCSASTGSTSGRRSSASAEEQHRSAQRGPRPGAVDRVEAAGDEGQVVRRRDDLGGDRPGPGERDAAVAGGDDDDARQRRHPRTRRTCSRPWTRARGGAGAAARAAVARADEATRRCRRSTTDCGWPSTAPARPAAPGSRADVSGKTGTAQVISLTGAKAATGQDRRARSRLVRVLRAARQPGDRRRDLRRARRARLLRRVDREAHHRHLLREEGRAAAAGAAGARHGDRGDDQAPCRRAGRRERRYGDVRTPALLPRRLAPARSRAAHRGDWRRDDLQHDLRAAAGRHRACRT